MATQNEKPGSIDFDPNGHFFCSIRKRLIAGYFVFVLFLIVVVSATLFVVNRIDNQMVDIAGRDVPTATTAARLANNLNGSLANLRGHLLSDREYFMNNLRHNWEQIDISVAELDMLSKDWTEPEDIQKWQEFKERLPLLREAQEKVKSIAHTDDEQPALKLLVVSRIWWKFSGGVLRAWGFGPDQAARSRLIGEMV